MQHAGAVPFSNMRLCSDVRVLPQHSVLRLHGYGHLPWHSGAQHNGNSAQHNGLSGTAANGLRAPPAALRSTGRRSTWHCSTRFRMGRCSELPHDLRPAARGGGPRTCRARRFAARRGPFCWQQHGALQRPPGPAAAQRSSASRSPVTSRGAAACSITATTHSTPRSAAQRPPASGHLRQHAAARGTASRGTAARGSAARDFAAHGSQRLPLCGRGRRTCALRQRGGSCTMKKSQLTV